MADETTTARSRRALLAAAAGGAAALAANAAMPLTTLAADPDDVVLGAHNTSPSSTSIATTTVGLPAFWASASGWGEGVTGRSETGPGLVGTSEGGFGVRSSSTSAAGVYATSGDGTDAAAIGDTQYTGVYGWAPAAPAELPYLGSGVWGSSDDIGVVGDGYWGVQAFGYYGVWAEGHVAVRGAASDPGGYGLLGVGNPASQYGLRVDGKVRLTHRSGRATIGAGKSSVSVTVTGITSSAKVYAVLNSNRSGRYVRAVVAATSKITIYLNSTVSSSTYVAWLVLD